MNTIYIVYISFFIIFVLLSVLLYLLFVKGKKEDKEKNLKVSMLKKNISKEKLKSHNIFKKHRQIIDNKLIEYIDMKDYVLVTEEDFFQPEVEKDDELIMSQTFHEEDFSDFEREKEDVDMDREIFGNIIEEEEDSYNPEPLLEEERVIDKEFISDEKMEVTNDDETNDFVLSDSDAIDLMDDMLNSDENLLDN